MNLEIRLFLGLSEFASLMQCQATGASIFRLESGAEFWSCRRKKVKVTKRMNARGSGG